MDEISGGKGKTRGRGLLAFGALVVIVTIGCNKEAAVQSHQSVPTKAIIRVGLFDERAKSARRAQPVVRLANSDEWYPDLTAGGDVFDFTVTLPSSDTLFIFPLGIKHSPIRFPLRVPSDLCTDGCARDAHIDVELDTDSVVATGATIVGIQAVGRFAPGSNYADPSGVYISRTELGDKWPLTVDAGWLDCVSPNLVLFRTRNVAYALNGKAGDSGYPDLFPIWRANPEISGNRINIPNNWIDRGIAICTARHQ